MRRHAAASGHTGSIRDQVIAFKREQIILAAVDLFFTNGYQQTTLDEVAGRLNVTKPFIYYHFKDKEALLSEISQRAVREANEALKTAIEAPGTPTERLHWAVKTLMKAVIEQQRYTAVFFREQKNLSEEVRGPVYAQHREYDKLLVTLLNEGIAKGEFTIADPHVCALGLSGMTGWAYNWYRPDGRLPADTISALMAEMALRTVGVDPKKIKAVVAASAAR
ncbi:TetR/AcrR family transcriptional regulator [Pseudorhodoferax sp.]|uniref:TetR/AcrR family transcriptional regulator n=1 Tax=Pseudorhodoferax sp. TaxID=1993553 RepID=UPI002DD68795|nr:TetR/AcrR family transcriptional regulator [Pseudorhodoferax sp.]